MWELTNWDHCAQGLMSCSALFSKWIGPRSARCDGRFFSQQAGLDYDVFLETRGGSRLGALPEPRFRRTAPAGRGPVSGPAPMAVGQSRRDVAL